MSDRKKKPKPVTLKIEGKRITAEKFLQATESFLGLIRNVADEITGQRGAVTWIVSAKKGSQIFTATPEADEAVIKNLHAIPEAVHRGFKGIERGSRRPRGYTDTALYHADRLATVVGNHDGDVSKIELIYEKQKCVMTGRTHEHVRNIMGSSRTEDGSVEGRVSLLSDKQGFRIDIDDVLTGHSVRCKPRDVDEQELIRAFRSRVIAIGTVHYRRDGAPVKIDVDQLRVLGKRSDLPGFDDVIGIFRRED